MSGAGRCYAPHVCVSYESEMKAGVTLILQEKRAPSLARVVSAWAAFPVLGSLARVSSARPLPAQALALEILTMTARVLAQAQPL